jgi:chromosome segregation ATPase
MTRQELEQIGRELDTLDAQSKRTAEEIEQLIDEIAETSNSPTAFDGA